MADAAVSILVIVGLLLARGFGWLWMDPLAGLVGAGVIVSWSIGLIRDAGAVLLDMNPDARLTAALRAPGTFATSGSDNHHSKPRGGRGGLKPCCSGQRQSKA